MPGGDMTNHKFESMSLQEGNDVIEFSSNLEYAVGEEVKKNYKENKIIQNKQNEINQNNN
jgi:hypothetical protein